jgi:hypothetical protein
VITNARVFRRLEVRTVPFDVVEALALAEDMLCADERGSIEGRVLLCWFPNGGLQDCRQPPISGSSMVP